MHYCLLRLELTFKLIQALYFDRYQKLLAPDMDPLRDVRVREKLASEMAPPGSHRSQGVIIDTEAVDGN